MEWKAAKGKDVLSTLRLCSQKPFYVTAFPAGDSANGETPQERSDEEACPRPAESVRLEWKLTGSTLYFECKLFISVYMDGQVKKLTTIQQIKNQLQDLEEPNEWLDELRTDERKGVQLAIKQWKKRYEKRQQLINDFLQKKAFDDAYKTTRISLIAGIDEAGRGPLAGPVVTAAVILPEESSVLLGVDDSKKISKVQRQRFAQLIKEQAVAYSIHVQSATVIDELNIYQATKQSMEAAVNQLSVKPHTVIADAMNLMLDCPAYSIVKGDEKSLSIAAASILAKTTRDDLMTELHEQFPWYGFDENAGYGTAKHLQGLETHGFTAQHRKSFEPIKTMWRNRQ